MWTFQSKQATSAVMAVVYITVGALMDVWTVIYYIYLTRRTVSDTAYLWCYGFFFSGVVLMVIAGVGMLNAMQLSTRERYHELGTLKAIGLTPAQMVRSVVEGAVALGALSLVVGIPLGLVLTYQGLQALVNSLGGLPHFQMGINWLDLALLVPATVAIAAVGAYLPARWAARVAPADVLRYE